MDALAAGSAVVFLWDKGGRDPVNGFGLRVTPAGVKSYVYQYRLGGREAKSRRLTIGKHGTWTPEGAREEARKLARLVDQGIDPAEAERRRREEAVSLAFDNYVDTFERLYLAGRWKRAAQGRRLLERHAVPFLKDRPLPTLRRADFNEVFDALASKPATARLLSATLRKMLRFAVERGDLTQSPLEGVSGPQPTRARDRVLSDVELIKVWRAAGELGRPFGPLIRLLLLTGQRREEVAGVQWRHLGRDDAIWSLPAERTKNGIAHLVHLSSSAIACFDEMAGGSEWPAEGLVFTRTGDTAVSGFSKAKARLDSNAELLESWRLHDLRRTLATGMQRLGVRFEVTEAILNHVSGAKAGVAGIYQRHDWAQERRVALDSWAEFVAALVS